MRLIAKLIITFLIFPSFAFSATENLDELEARIPRQLTNTYTPATLEDAGNNYIWNPESFSYIDVTTGNEVLRLAGGNNLADYVPDISFAQYSADGSLVVFGSYGRETQAHSNDDLQMVVGSDGSNLRPFVNASSNTTIRSRFWHWSPVDNGVAYVPGRNYAGEGYTDTNYYKVTVTPTSETTALHLVFPTEYNDITAKKGITADGKRMIFSELYKKRWFPAVVYPTPSLSTADGFTSNRPSYDDYWGRTSERELDAGTVSWYHDQYAAGGDGCDNGVWFHILPESTEGTWWKMRFTGTDPDDGPLHISDNTYPYAWGGEMEPVQGVNDLNCVPKGDCNSPNRDPYTCANQPTIDAACYFSHYTVDRWGKYIIYSNSETTGGVGIWNEDTHQHEIESFPLTYGAQHHDWSAFSDWSASSGDDDDPNQKILTQNFTDSGSQKALCGAHFQRIGYSKYERNARPSQSPDGTKVLYHTSFLSSDKNLPDIFQTVAYYPYPSEIKTLSATDGTATIEVHWNTAGTTRGYTTRGWPSETTDDPPPPREIENFRLWRSTDKATWTPVKTFSYDIWDKYDFSDGTWDSGTEATNTWTTTDTPGNGAFYYAVTSIETSGLESRTLSNIFAITITAGAGTGSQDTTYPADPGADADIISSYDSDLIRGVHIYASDISTPSPVQQNRIASIATTSFSSWIDWSGNQNGTTNYSAYEFDTQGYQSLTPLAITVTHQDSPATALGQYTLKVGAETDPIVTLEADKEAPNPTSYTFSFTVVAGQFATNVVSSNGFTVTCDDGNCFDEETETGVVSNVTSPITDTLTVTQTDTNTGDDSITITLTPTPATGVTLIDPTGTPRVIDPTKTPIVTGVTI